MNITKENVADIMQINFNEDIIYGEDEACITVPERFATVNFMLWSTSALVREADRMRKEDGFLPMFDDSGEFDCDGWYDFYIDLNDYSETNIDACITFVVGGSDQADNEHIYCIPLSPDEQEIVYGELDRQCKYYIEKSCEELLAEARKEMEE